MICDPMIEVICDRKGCQSAEMVRAGSDRKIESRLQKEKGWIVRDGKHYCSPECAK